MESIALTQGLFALVDAADAAWLSRWKWCAARHGKTFYAVRQPLLSEGRGKRLVAMHSELLLGLKGLDHADRDGLNNRRSNLRLPPTWAHQMANRGKAAGKSSQYLGVSWTTRLGSWRASLHIGGGKLLYLGQFATEVEAARAYDRAKVERFGEYANLNGV